MDWRTCTGKVLKILLGLHQKTLEMEKEEEREAEAKKLRQELAGVREKEARLAELEGKTDSQGKRSLTRELEIRPLVSKMHRLA